MRQAVIFDWGGVLMRTVDHEPRHSWDQRLGLAEGSVERIVHGSEAWEQAQRGETSPDEYWATVGEQLRLTRPQLTEFRRDFFSADRLDGDLLALITDLRARGVLVGLLSNYSLELLDILEDQQLTGLFDCLVISGQTGLMKPDPRAYQAILEQLGVAPDHALFVDDAPPNIEGALALGITAILFESCTDLRAAIEDWLAP